MTEHTLTLGPEHIRAIGQAVDALLPLLTQASFGLLPSGNLEFTDPAPAAAAQALRRVVDEALPDELRQLLGAHSGLGWRVFFGHVLAYWLPRRRAMGFLRALVDRAALHRVELKLHWNQGRQVVAELHQPGSEPLLWGGGFGVAAAVGASYIWRRQPLLGLVLIGAGILAGRIYMRVVLERTCGDPLCRAPLGRKDTICPSCGAELAFPPMK